MDAISSGAVLTTGTNYRFSTSNMAASRFQRVDDQPRKDNLVNWMLGGEITTPSTDPSTKTPAEDQLFSVAVGAVRPSIHGDVLHGRPAAVNYDGKDGLASSCTSAPMTACCAPSMATRPNLGVDDSWRKLSARVGDLGVRRTGALFQVVTHADQLAAGQLSVDPG